MACSYIDIDGDDMFISLENEAPQDINSAEKLEASIEELLASMRQNIVQSLPAQPHSFKVPEVPLRDKTKFKGASRRLFTEDDAYEAEAIAVVYNSKRFGAFPKAKKVKTLLLKNKPTSKVSKAKLK